jgi:hypothetical protein
MRVAIYLVHGSRLHARPWVWHRNVAQPCKCSTCAASPLYTCRFLGMPPPIGHLLQLRASTDS